MEPKVHTITISYSIEPVSKTQWRGKIYVPGETLVLEPTTKGRCAKGRCAKRLCTLLMPELVKEIEAAWPDGIDDPVTEKDIEEPSPDTTAEARERQLETLPPLPPPIPPEAMPPIQHTEEAETSQKPPSCRDKFRKHKLGI